MGVDSTGGFTMDELIAAVAQYRQSHPECEKDWPACLPVTWKQQVVRVMLQAAQKGACMQTLMQQLGVSKTTLYHWRSRYSAQVDDSAETALLRPVSVQPRTAAHAGGLTLTAPSGHVLSGLTLKEAAELLLRLS
jgi:transposase-like protein